MNFIPQNELEVLLMKAAKDPVYRPQFYDTFVKSKIFIIPHVLPEIESGKVREGQSIQISNIEVNGKPYIPIFSSVKRVELFVQKEVKYLAMNALELLKFTEGAELLLNPNSEYGKEFTKPEIKSLINGSLGKPETLTISKETSVQIGQPANYPHELANALSRAFRKTKEVKKAYLAHIFNPDIDKKAHTIIALEVSGDWDKVMSIAGIVTQGVKIPDPPVDFIRLTIDCGLYGYFAIESKPFYHKKIFGIFW